MAEYVNMASNSEFKERVVRVFVSSTFQDMVEDRNELMTHVWPELRKFCRKRAVEFVEIDLRWGITEEQSERDETLRYCLKEIDRCRPFFIGLLGERYGWVPKEDAFTEALLDEQKWLKDKVEKHSVTELEIQHGVLNNPDMAGRAFFYLRNPEYAESKGEAYLSAEVGHKEKLLQLKEHVKAKCSKKSIPLHDDYRDPAHLAELVLEDLKKAIDAEFPEDEVPDAWTQGNREHEAYARTRITDYYVGREAYFEQLDAYVLEGAQGAGFAVLGASGGGKSALLANWGARWREEHSKDFLFQHYVGSSTKSADHYALIRRLIEAIIRWCLAGEPDFEKKLEEELKQIPSGHDDLKHGLQSYLDRLDGYAHMKKVNAVIVIDALNQLDKHDDAQDLGWLPSVLTQNIRLIVSTLPGDAQEAIELRKWSKMAVEPLELNEREHMVGRYLRHFSQELSTDRARRIAAVSISSNPLFIKTLLDDLRVTGNHEQLDAQIDDYLSAKDLPELFEKVLERYERDYERDRTNLVRDTLSFIWSARRGLTEHELLKVLSSEGQEMLPAAYWIPLSNALIDGLVDKDGVLSFAHDYLRNAVAHRYLAESETVKQYRTQLVDDFKERSLDLRQADELPWLLKQVDQKDDLRQYLLYIPNFLLLKDLDDQELFGYWIWLGEEKSMGQGYGDAFQLWSERIEDQTDISYAANSLTCFLYTNAALYSEAEDLMRRALEIDEASYGKDHPKVAISLNNLGMLLQDTNRREEAEPLIRRALKIDEASYGKDHPRITTYLNNLGMLLQSMNRLEEAEPLIRRALEIDESSYGTGHPLVAISLNNLGMLLQATNRREEAEPLIRRALKIEEVNYGKDHPRLDLSLNNLALLLWSKNRLDEAESLMHRALEISQASYGNDHPKVAISLNSLSSLLQATNRLDEAESLMRRALEISQASYDKDHPMVARDLNNLGKLLLATNRLDEAEPLMRRALEVVEASYGKDHSLVATFLNDLGVILQETNRLDEAEPLMRRALEIDESSYGKDHPKVAIHLNNLGYLLQATNRLDEAEPLLRRALDIWLKFTSSTGYMDPHLKTAVGYYESLLFQMGKADIEVTQILSDLLGEYGLSFGNEENQSSEVRDSFLSDKLQEIAENLHKTDPELFMELVEFYQ